MEMIEIVARLIELKPGPYQARKDFDPAQLLELAESIGQRGIINPPLVALSTGSLSAVSPSAGSGGGQKFALLAGERRWRASCALAMVQSGTFSDLAAAATHAATAEQFPGLGGAQIIVRLVSGTEPELHAAAVVDNHQRVNLNPVEEAQDFYNLKQRYDWTIWRVAEAVGRSDAYVRGRLRLLELEPEIQQLIAGKRLSKDAQVVDALLGIPDAAVRLKLARRFAERSSSIRAIVAGCQRVGELMELARQNQVAPTVALPSIRVIPPQPPVAGSTPPGPPFPSTGSGGGGESKGGVCLCEDCREQINQLAEELCGRCAAKGLSAECLTCPGVIEFVERLVRLTQC
jgi:ParB-like chromosome segregation protein Spo0J